MELPFFFLLADDGQADLVGGEGWLIDYQGVSEPDGFNSVLPEAGIAGVIMQSCGGMVRSIDFDGEVNFRGVEIEDVAENRGLASELHTELTPPKEGPEGVFRWCGPVAHGASLGLFPRWHSV